MIPHVPWGLLGVTLATCALGVWNLASAARNAQSSVWGSQAAYIGFGLVAALGVCLVDYRWIQRMTVPIYVLNIVALLALHVIGHKAKGAESWFVIGPFRVQPAEFMKIGIVLILAKFFHDDYRPNQPAYGLLGLWKPLLLAGVPLVLVLIQPDLGTAMMIALTVLTMVLFARVKKVLVGILVAGLLTAGVVIWNDYVREPGNPPHATILRHRLKPHQSQRISSWLDPEADLRGASYHATQSKIAVGSGGLWRQGLARGNPDRALVPPRAAHRLHLLGLGRGARLRLLHPPARALRDVPALRARGRRRRARSLRRVRRGRRRGDGVLAGVREHRDGDRACCR